MNEDGKIEGIVHDFIILLFNMKGARPVYKMTEITGTNFGRSDLMVIEIRMHIQNIRLSSSNWITKTVGLAPLGLWHKSQGDGKLWGGGGWENRVFRMTAECDLGNM